MARWKARVRLHIRHNWTFFASCYRWGATRQNVSRLATIRRGLGQFEPRFQGEGVIPGEHVFGFYKTIHILLSDSANCTVLRAVVLTQYWRVADRRTDGRNCRSYSTALAVRALRRAVKMFAKSKARKHLWCNILWMLCYCFCFWGFVLINFVHYLCKCYYSPWVRAEPQPKVLYLRLCLHY